MAQIWMNTANGWYDGLRKPAFLKMTCCYYPYAKVNTGSGEIPEAILEVITVQTILSVIRTRARNATMSAGASGRMGAEVPGYCADIP